MINVKIFLKKFNFIYKKLLTLNFLNVIISNLKVEEVPSIFFVLFKNN